MLLRRIIEHVKAQNWTAIVLDFMIVVSGVFIGIQVSNLNDARADQRRAAGYLERMAADLSADLVTYQDRMQFWEKVSQYGARGINYAETGESEAASQWELLLSYFQASQVAEFFATETTYRELESAGELDLVADTSLREELAQYYSLGVNPALVERPAYRENVREKVPLAIQIFIWNECYHSDAKGRQQMKSCDAPIDESKAAEIVELIRSDHELMGELRYWMSTMHVASMIGRDRSQAAAALLEKVKGKLGAKQLR